MPISPVKPTPRPKRIQVKALADAGTHPKYGRIKAGVTYTINEVDFSAALFERLSDASAPAAVAEPGVTKGRK